MSDRDDGISKFGDVTEEEDGVLEGIGEDTDRPTGWVLVRDDTLTTAGGAGHGPTDSEDDDFSESVEPVSGPEIFDEPERFEA